MPDDELSHDGVPGPDPAADDDADLGVDPAMLERLTRIALDVDDDDLARLAPPPDLRARITAAAAAWDADEVDPTASAEPAVADGVSLDRPAATSTTDAPPATTPLTPADIVAARLPSDAPRAEVVSLDDRRRNMTRRVVIAVAASLVLLIGTGVLLTRGGSSPDPQSVARAALEPLEPTDATADARLVSDDGDLRLVLHASDMAAAPSGQHYELWLLDPASSTAAPVPLGPMTGSVTVPVPAEVDTDQYDVVDISLQRDGQSEHSGHSLLRGTLA